MDLIIKLPKALQSLSNQEVPSVVQERLHYLWNASNNLALHSPALAHRMSRSFVQLSNKFNVDLPDYITCRLCKHCCSVQIPSETCSVRLRQRSLKSSSRRSKDKLKNQIVSSSLLSDLFYMAIQVFRCTMCSGVSNKVTCYSTVDDNNGLNGKKRSFGDMQVNSMVSLSSTMSSPGPKFSFLNKTKSPAVVGSGGHSFGSGKVDSLDFISFNGNGNKSINSASSQSNLSKNKSSNGLFTSQLMKSSSGTNLSGLGAAANKGKSFNGGTNNSSNGGGLMGMATKLNSQSNNSISSMTSLFNVTNKLNSAAATPASASGGGVGLNLLELERQNKKNKKKKV